MWPEKQLESLASIQPVRNGETRAGIEPHDPLALSCALYRLNHRAVDSWLNQDPAYFS